VNTVIADPAGSAWTFGASMPTFGGSRLTFGGSRLTIGGSMLSFAFPMLLFVVVTRTAIRGEQEPEGGE
jgi:hypothetical protein